MPCYGIICPTTSRILILHFSFIPTFRSKFFRSNTFTTYFYNHHVSAIEGLVISKVVDVVLDYQNVSPEVRLASLLGTFFLGFIFRHTVRRMRTTSRTLSLGENFLMIMIYWSYAFVHTAVSYIFYYLDFFTDFAGTCSFSNSEDQLLY